MDFRFALLRGVENEKQTAGRLLIMGSDNKIYFDCACIELPWRFNQRNISCIPAGTYPIVLEMSPKYGMCWEIKNVPNRDEIKIHNGNFYFQIEGCILVGRYHKDINADGVIDVADSRNTRRRMEQFMASKGITRTTITVINL